VKQGFLQATIITMPTAGTALEILAKAVHGGTMPPERTLLPAKSFPSIAELQKSRGRVKG